MDNEPTISDWTAAFSISPTAELDCFLALDTAWPVGTLRASPPEFRRRLLAAAISYRARLRSIDYVKRTYVSSDQFENEKLLLGDEISYFLQQSINTTAQSLKDLQTPESYTFGQFGAEITLYKIPEVIDSARILSNQGVFLQAISVLRVALEMISWSVVAFHCVNELEVRNLRAQSCLSSTKKFYSSAGQVYGYLSQFSHWGHAIHSHFLHIDDDGVGLIRASSRHRAVGLTLCLLMLDVLLEATREIYKERSIELLRIVQNTSKRSGGKKIHKLINKVVSYSKYSECERVRGFLS